MQTISNAIHAILPSWNEDELHPAAPQEVPAAEIERGRRLRDMQRAPGWKDVLDALEAPVLEAEHDLINYRGFNKDELYRLQCRARAMREQFQNFQISIQNAVDTAESAFAMPEGLTVGVGANY